MENRQNVMVTAVHRDRYELMMGTQHIFGRLKSANFYNTQEVVEFPTVGDQVEISYNPSGDSLILRVMPRKSVFMRLNSTQGLPDQAVAANFDYVMITMSLNRDFHVSKLERYLTVAWQSGGTPVIVLTKADLCDNREDYLSQLIGIAAGVEVFCISSVTGEGIAEMERFFRKDKTSVLLGSSGVGKSSLVNCLTGREEMLTGGIREADAQGRHTTTYKQCMFLPDKILLPNGTELNGGGCIIDTPGMRKLLVGEVEDGVKSSYEDVEELAASCRFANCSHTKEPGCAILAALENGTLDKRRWKNYLDMLREERYAKEREQIMKKKKEGQSRKMQKTGRKKDLKWTQEMY